MDALDLLKRDRKNDVSDYCMQHAGKCPIALTYDVWATGWQSLRIEDKLKLLEHGWTADLYRDFILWGDVTLLYGRTGRKITWEEICTAWSQRDKTRIPTTNGE